MDMDQPFFGKDYNSIKNISTFSCQYDDNHLNSIYSNHVNPMVSLKDDKLLHLYAWYMGNYAKEKS